MFGLRGKIEKSGISDKSVEIPENRQMLEIQQNKPHIRIWRENRRNTRTSKKNSSNSLKTLNFSDFPYFSYCTLKFLPASKIA
jgi:hypothetical protein